MGSYNNKYTKEIRNYYSESINAFYSNDRKDIIKAIKDYITDNIKNFVKDYYYITSDNLSVDYKVDVFGDSIVWNIICIECTDLIFNATIVYHVDFCATKNKYIVPTKEYIALKYNKLYNDNYIYIVTDKLYKNIIKLIIKSSNIFLSTIEEAKSDNIDYTIKTLPNSIDTDSNQYYEMISQTPNSTVGLLISKNTALVYSLPTSSLNNTTTHVEEILVMDRLKENIGFNEEGYISQCLKNNNDGLETHIG